MADDGSTDGTADIVRNLERLYPDRVKVILREKNIGSYNNYIGIFEKAEGDYLAITDGDDYWLPGKLQSQIEFLRANPDCPVVYTNAAVIDSEKKLVGLFTSLQPSRLDTGDLLRKGNFLNFSSLLCRMENMRVTLEISGPYIDYNLHLRLSLYGPIGFINSCYAVYRSGVPNSMTTSGADNVADLYWSALCDIATFDVPRGDLLLSRAYFFRSLTFRSLRQLRIFYILGWANTVRKEAGILPIFLALFQIFGIILISIPKKILHLLNRKTSRIFHG